MLGNDKTFHDRLSWLLTIPIASLAGGAAYLAFLAVEVAAEGEQVGSASWWISTARAAACGFALARVAAAVAPARKAWAGAVVGILYGAAASSSGLTIASAFAWAGAAAGFLVSRGLPDDAAEPAGKAT